MDQGENFNVKFYRLGKPAARIGDMHTCPAVSPGGVPHAEGAIIALGNSTVFIEGKPAATVGDSCLCNGGIDEIVSGSTGVFIEGREAARQGDRCAHGGVIIGGSATVFIGERMGNIFFSRPRRTDKMDNWEESIEPQQEEKNRIINEAIGECIFLLERKLQSLEVRDEKTMDDFKTWFGFTDEGAVDLILNRILRALDIAKVLTLDNFGVIEDEFKRAKLYASVDGSDEFYTFYLGALFWKKWKSAESTGSTLIHELSHFDDIGCTRDFDYGDEQCLYLAKYASKRALYNADNFEYFIKS